MDEDETTPEGTPAASHDRPRGLRLRVFCAVWLPTALRTAIAAHASRLRHAVPEARASWPRLEALHITLKFLGPVESNRLGDLSRAAGAAAGGISPFPLTVEEAGTFPPSGTARVLWLGIRDASGSLARLQRQLEERCEEAGFPREARPFRPHLTVARLRPSGGAAALSDAHRRSAFAPHTFEVSELLVMRSELGPGGSRYATLSQHAFR